MKVLLFFPFLTFTTITFSQVDCLDEYIAKCEIDTSYQVFDYFNQRTDSLFCKYGRASLMDLAICYGREKKKFVYVTRKTTYNDGRGLLDVFIEGKLLFRYSMKDDRIEGIAWIYYPFEDGRVAYQGFFINNKLHGMLFYMNNRDGSIVHSIFFKNGRPTKILYDWNLFQTKKIYRTVNKRKYFKGGKSTGVVEYPFLK